jgi:hypothetical protein
MILPVGAQDDDQQLWLVRKIAGGCRSSVGRRALCAVDFPDFDDPNSGRRVRTMHVLLVGDGQLGTALRKVLETTAQHQVTTWRRPAFDMTLPATADEVAALAPDAVINAAAWTKVDSAEATPTPPTPSTRWGRSTWPKAAPAAAPRWCRSARTRSFPVSPVSFIASTTARLPAAPMRAASWPARSP